MSAYPLTVAAALAETKSKFALAEALAREIGPKRQGQHPARGEKSVGRQLEEARQEVIDAGGEPRTARTLEHYRLTALWVEQPSPGTGRRFAWIPGVSFTAHREACEAHMSYHLFAQSPGAAAKVRRNAGRAPAGRRREAVAVAPPGTGDEGAPARRRREEPSNIWKVVAALSDVTVEGSKFTAHASRTTADGLKIIRTTASKAQPTVEWLASLEPGQLSTDEVPHG